MDELGETFAFLLDDQGRARPLPLDALPEWKPSDGHLWLNLPPDLPDLPRALEQLLHLSPEARDSLLAEVSRVRIDVIGGDQLVLLMLHPDVVHVDAPQRTLRILGTVDRSVTVAAADQPAIADLRRRLASGRGPQASELFITFAGTALAESALRLADLDDRLSELEARFEERRDEDANAERLRRLRRILVEQRRFVSLCRDAVVRVGLLDVDWLHAQRDQLKDHAARAGSIVKELDALVERARILREDEKARQDAKSQRILYLLTIISGVFLPLSFITGLLGVNLGGMPGTQWNGAFLLLVLVLIVIAVVEWRALLRREVV
ncbi:CorA family divalent cation transporter [Corallococcus silvisoli]|uniref:CorA family divalent cation transporter n=1 Tax=Corallococcus silvisoli TaxID=2697031 RepID=UPI0013768F3D|nr:CorA family divalent cation transporter [Corallococcus silvisoli]NBD11385.1 hypothetical protein [Corallococcus silvisoli]